jgi:cholest-4-en-3-one 26-monooxygenase
MTQTATPDTGLELLDPDYYVASGYPHDIWRRLRAEAPVFRVERDEGFPYWAITKQADIIEISKQPLVFKSGEPLSLDMEERDADTFEFPPTLIAMNPPKHGPYRQLISRRFTPSALRRMNDDVESIAQRILDGVTTGGEMAEIDFVEDVAATLPIAVIAWLLGVPDADWRRLYDWTNATIGSNDPEYQQEGKDRQETARAAMLELFHYFNALIESRRQEPKDDLVSALVHAEIDGKPLELGDILSYCLIIVVAGNETTRNATSGGLLAFIEHPEQWAKLQRNPERVKPAVEEVLRWTSPIIHFNRTATRDYELRGQKIREGDHLALFYPSANRDEELFDDPYRFDIERAPNRHIAFGVGEHFCLGAHVARLELEVMFRHLARRLEHVELAGPVQRLRSTLVGGLKHVPIRYKLHAVN